MQTELKPLLLAPVVVGRKWDGHIFGFKSLQSKGRDFSILTPRNILERLWRNLKGCHVSFGPRFNFFYSMRVIWNWYFLRERATKKRTLVTSDKQETMVDLLLWASQLLILSSATTTNKTYGQLNSFETIPVAVLAPTKIENESESGFSLWWRRLYLCHCHCHCHCGKSWNY